VLSKDVHTPGVTPTPPKCIQRHTTELSAIPPCADKLSLGTNRVGDCVAVSRTEGGKPFDEASTCALSALSKCQSPTRWRLRTF